MSPSHPELLHVAEEAAAERRSPLPRTELGCPVPRRPPRRAAPGEGQAEERAVLVTEGMAFCSGCGAERQRDGRAPVTGCGTLICHKSHFPAPEVTLFKQLDLSQLSHRQDGHALTDPDRRGC